MNEPNIANALIALGFKSGWKIKEGKIVKWWSEKEQPSAEAIQAKLIELQADYEPKQYQRDRESKYPSIQDVVVALAEKEEGDNTMWQEITAKRAEVKAKYPKPT